MNILDHVAITVPCNICSGDFSVPASVVLEGQKMVAPGCPGCSDYECEPWFVARLIDPEALAELQLAWKHFEASAASHGGMRVQLAGLPAASGLDEVRERRLRVKALQRWENEGGRPQPS